MPHKNVKLDSNSSSSSEDSDYYNDELRDKKYKCDLATIDTVAVTEKNQEKYNCNSPLLLAMFYLYFFVRYNVYN